MYQTEATKKCQRQIDKLTSKNKALFDALDAQLKKIKENPHHFKPLGNVLAGYRRVHVLKCFVMTYDIDEPNQKVILKRFSHHDEAY
ncbi:TPA: type II toxin-antitoxin system RelE/ParE family toxin [Candidatus Micrarchaeota archaeon]|nr:type II toxin-antitoxin system RelE/ParE family toxin [Candidatus Micrarchaeota archaeon]HIH30620.1 type II toxin-antitoxin system RelE/ParE family toxin [Candidatus Micrarchaeota archaeon]